MGGQTYLRAVEELAARREEALLGKRRPTKLDSEIMEHEAYYGLLADGGSPAIRRKQMETTGKQEGK